MFSVIIKTLRQVAELEYLILKEVLGEKKAKYKQDYLQTIPKDNKIRILYNSLEYVRAYKKPNVWAKFKFVSWLLIELGAYNRFWLCKYKVEGCKSDGVDMLLKELTFNKAVFLRKEVSNLFEVEDLK